MPGNYLHPLSLSLLAPSQGKEVVSRLCLHLLYCSSSALSPSASLVTHQTSHVSSIRCILWFQPSALSLWRFIPHVYSTMIWCLFCSVASSDSSNHRQFMGLQSSNKAAELYFIRDCTFDMDCHWKNSRS